MPFEMAAPYRMPGTQPVALSASQAATEASASMASGAARATARSSQSSSKQAKALGAVVSADDTSPGQQRTRASLRRNLGWLDWLPRRPAPDHRRRGG